MAEARTDQVFAYDEETQTQLSTRSREHPGGHYAAYESIQCLLRIGNGENALA